MGTWLIERGYHEWMKLEDPRKYPRVDNSRTVTRAGDPSGRPIGTRLRYESARDYESRCDRYKEKAMKIWAKAMRGYTSDARSTALQAPRYEPQALFDIIKKGHGDKSEKQVTKLVRKFVGNQKRPADDIGEFNRKWADTVRVMKANGMDLPPKFLVNLYLISLGEQYSTLEAVVSVLPAEQQTLIEVMRRAADHTVGERDEADNSAVALIAKLEREGYVMQKKQKTEGAFAAAAQQRRSGCPICDVCHKPGHVKEQCFAPGGGLAHYDAQQRRAFLQEKWNRRTQRQQPATQQKATESAAVAQEQPDQAGLIAALEQTVAEQKEKMAYAKERVGGVIDIGF